jgi:putative DNA primase/helicase
MEVSAMKHEFETNQVKEDARGRWERVLLALAPPLKNALERQGKHVPCPVHGGRDGFRLFRDVAETGGGICNSCGSFANGFALLMWINGWDFGQALRKVAEQVGSRPRSDQAPDDEKCREQLNRTWRASVPLTHPSAEAARLYLARRGLSVKAPEALRFHPALGYFEDNHRLADYPTLLAQISGQGGDAVTIHRTYLTHDGHKAPVNSPKKLMRHPRARQMTGGAIRLTAAAPRLAITEGIETALAVTEATGMPAWATGNAHLLSTFMPPKGVGQILVFADKDRPSRQHPSGHGQEAARELVKRLWSMGIRAGAIAPAMEIPEGKKGVDWLDVFVNEGRAGFPALVSVEMTLHQAA